MFYADIARAASKEFRERKMKARQERERWLKERADNFEEIVGSFNKVLQDELADTGYKVFINESQVNVECPDGDKFYLTCSLRHCNVRVDFLCRKHDPQQSISLIEQIRKSLGGKYKFSDNSRKRKTGTVVRFMVPQEDVGQVINKFHGVVKPNLKHRGVDMNSVLSVSINWREGFANHPEILVQVDELEMVANWRVILTTDKNHYNVQESTCGNFRFYNVTRVDDPKNWGASRSSHFNFALGVTDEEGFIDVEVNESPEHTLHPQKRLLMGVKLKHIKHELDKLGVFVFQRLGTGDGFDKDNDFEVSASSEGLFKPSGDPFGNEKEYPVKKFDGSVDRHA